MTQQEHRIQVGYCERSFPERLGMVHLHGLQLLPSGSLGSIAELIERFLECSILKYRGSCARAQIFHLVHNLVGYPFGAYRQ